jgi:hypothetical protein
LPSSKDQNKNPLDGKPPSYADIFKINRSDEAPTSDGVALAVGSPLPANEHQSMPPDDGEILEKAKYLIPYKAERSGRIAAAALGLASIDKLPPVYSQDDGRRFAQYVESHVKELKQWFDGERGQEARAKVLPEVDRMFNKGLEIRRVDLLLRWFRDRQTPADLNPQQIVDPERPAKGSVFQLMHPLLFNALLYVVIVIGVFLTFAFFFKGA